MNDNVFSGKGWLFPPQFSAPARGPEMTTGSLLIEQAIHILLNTRLGERVLVPNFGSHLGDFTFEMVDASVMADLREEIANAIIAYEPRVNLKSILFDSSGIYDGVLNIELNYVINQSNHLSNMVYPFYLVYG